MSLLGTLLGYEIYLRVTVTAVDTSHDGFFGAALHNDPGLLYIFDDSKRRFRPSTRAVIRNHPDSGTDVVFEINSVGFRDEEFPEIKPEQERRILVIGDSIVLSSALNHQDTWVQIAEERLNQGLDSREYRLINAGIGDVGIKDYVEMLVSPGLDSNPDLVLFALYLNDTVPSWNQLQPLGDSFIERYSFLYREIRHQLLMKRYIQEVGIQRFAWIDGVERLDWRSDPNAFLELVEMAKFDWGSAWDQASWDEIESKILESQDIAAEAGVSLALIVFPVAYQVAAKHLPDYPQSKAWALSGRLSLPLLDLLPALRVAAQQGQGPLFFDQCHLTREGSRIVGRELADFVGSHKELLGKP